MKIVINEGEIIPYYPWYLPAYDEFRLNYTKACVVCYPIGINLIVMYFRKLVHYLHWNCRSLTNQDNLDFLNDRVEYLTEYNKKLKKVIEVCKQDYYKVRSNIKQTGDN